MIQFDRCLFEVLTSMGLAELQVLCDFVDNKVVALQNDLNKVIAMLGALDTYKKESEDVLNSITDIINDGVTPSTLMARVLKLSPACSDLQTVFGGIIDAGSASYTALSEAQYIYRQVSTTQNVQDVLRREADEAIQSLRAVCTIVKLLVESQAQKAEKNFFGGAQR